MGWGGGVGRQLKAHGRVRQTIEALPDRDIAAGLRWRRAGMLSVRLPDELKHVAVILQVYEVIMLVRALLVGAE
jgi:hypothetical protein